MKAAELSANIRVSPPLRGFPRLVSPLCKQGGGKSRISADGMSFFVDREGLWTTHYFVRSPLLSSGVLDNVADHKSFTF